MSDRVTGEDAVFDSFIRHVDIRRKFAVRTAVHRLTGHPLTGSHRFQCDCVDFTTGDFNDNSYGFILSRAERMRSWFKNANLDS